MSKFISLFVCVVAVCSSGVYAVTAEEKAAFFEAFKPLVTECSQSHGVTDDEIKAAKESNSAGAINPCFFGCVLKKLEIINGEGDYNPEKALSTINPYVKKDEDRVKFEEIGKKCASVNDQAVSDGNAGCDRSKLLLECFLQNKAQLPI